MLPAFGWQAVATQWEFAPVVTAAAAIAAAFYLWGVARVARRHPARPWPRWRAAMFLAGLAVVVVATESGVGAYDNALFWDHMIQHLLLLMVAPPLLVVGQPFTLLLHASRNPLHTWAKRAMRSRAASLLTSPPFVLAAYAATVVGTHLTGLARAMLTDQFLHNGEHVLYLVVGYLFFLPVVGREPIRWRLSYPARFVILALAMPIDTFTGLILGYANYGLSVGPRPPGAPNPVEDVHWGGAMMWIGGDAIMLALMMAVVFMWARDDAGSVRSGWLESARRASFEQMVAGAPGARAASVPPAAPQRGTVDDEAHLAAYNAYLARLNQPGDGPGGGHGSGPGGGHGARG